MPKSNWVLFVAIGGLAASASAQESPRVIFNGVVLECDRYGCWERLTEHDDQTSSTQTTNHASTKERYEPQPVLDAAIANSPAPDSPSKEETQRDIDDLKAQQGMERWAFWMFVATSIGVWLIGWTLWETRRTSNLAARSLRNSLVLGRLQLREARKSTGAALQAVGVTQTMGEKQTQAYLICNSGEYWLREYFDAEKRRPNYGISARLNLSNKGQSPARAVVIKFDAWIMRSDVASSRSEGFLNHEADTFSADVGPSDHETALIEFPLFSPDQQGQFEKGLHCVDIRGTLNWKNEFGSDQQQRFHVQSPAFWNSDFFDRGDLAARTYKLFGIASTPWSKIL